MDPHRNPEDLYVALAGWEGDDAEVAIEAHVNPMVRWVWVGAGTVVLGGVLALLPRGAARRAGAAVGEEVAARGVVRPGTTMFASGSSPWHV